MMMMIIVITCPVLIFECYISVMDKAGNKRKLVYCSHCDAFLPRKTAYNHSKRSSENQSFLFPAESGVCIDAKRRKRCVETSAD